MAERQWVWTFDAPPATVWSVLADTARFNEAAGFPKHLIEETPDGDGFVSYCARAKVGPMTLEWDEIPVQWVANRYFLHCREFRNGPLVRMCARLELAPAEGGSRVDYALEAEPRGALGRLVLGPFFKSAGRSFHGLVESTRAFLAGDRPEPFLPPPVTPEQAVRARVDGLVSEIEASGNGHGLARRLADYLFTAAEQDLTHLRARRLSRLWQVEERPVVELCLQAARSGLLNMDWVLLCPRCRGAKSSSPSLDRLPENAHCASCNIDYGREFQRNVELTFRPAAWLRPIEAGEFCLYGPMSTPHVVAQQTLAPGEVRDISADIQHGSYRLRTLHPGRQEDIEWRSGGFPEVSADETGACAGAATTGEGVRLRNTGGRPVTIVIEDRAWVEDALTAHRVTTMQTFRDLFADQSLRPGDEVSIEHITLMFTDLKGSTALYEKVGDGTAYMLVRDHFAFLAEAVRAHDGAIVKMIGDAVMAVFMLPADALGAAIAIQRGVGRFNAAHAEAPIAIKLGLHAGPVVAVRLNNRLDYFGGTVNMAARLEAMSTGGDIVLSTELASDPAVAPLLVPLSPAHETAPLKGFAEPVPFLRLTPAAILQA
ncbi:MAG: adenylate/guanylate cyclase domain-containing protein [Alphaproteobacteria bacterium]|nr:adenylate/guanylate cyclase domain-containing protein [Alphaproteobacteria bacterium]